MVTVTKYLTQADLKVKLCDCQNEEKFKILFKEVSESEIKVKPEQVNKGAYILRDEKTIILCEGCQKIYFIKTTFEGSMSEQYIGIDSLEEFEGTIKELRSVINNMFDEYEEEITTVATDDHTIKILDKYEDEEKIITKYAYLNREDKNLYKDLM